MEEVDLHNSMGNGEYVEGNSELEEASSDGHSYFGWDTDEENEMKKDKDSDDYKLYENNDEMKEPEADVSYWKKSSSSNHIDNIRSMAEYITNQRVSDI